jgi:hypothetical protein
MVRDSPQDDPRGIHMDYFFIYVICVANPFAELRWNWTPTEIPMQVYCQYLWEQYIGRNNIFFFINNNPSSDHR